MNSLSNPGQLVIRNSQWLECSRLLMVGMPADNLAFELLSGEIAAHITGLSKDFADYRQMETLWQKHAALSLVFGPALTSSNDEKFDGILLFLQKSKPLMDFWLLMAQSLLVEGGAIWLVGENSEGIKSWKKRLKQSFTQVKVIDNARHCVLLEASEPLNTVNTFDWQAHFESFTLDQAGAPLTIHSLPGVFSHGRLDVGTKVLLETLTDLPAGKVLDFGCGAGVISAYINSLPGQRNFTLVDCDALALDSSRKTLSDMGAESVKVVASDGLSDIEGRFNLIISNPPFHQGVKTHYAVTEQFLQESYHHLLPGGELRIVANSFLKYRPLIMEAFGCCETILCKNGFSIYRAIKH